MSEYVLEYMISAKCLTCFWSGPCQFGGLKCCNENMKSKLKILQLIRPARTTQNARTLSLIDTTYYIFQELVKT